MEPYTGTKGFNNDLISLNQATLMNNIRTNNANLNDENRVITYNNHYATYSYDNGTMFTVHTGNQTTDSIEQCNITTEKVEIMQQIAFYSIVIFCVVAFAIGIVGDAVLMWIIIRNKIMHHAPNVFIFSIALGDFVYVLVFTPFAIFIFVLSEWPFGTGMCKFIMFLQTLSMGVSIFTLTFMSWDRYTAIARPMEKQRNASVHKTCMRVICIWLGAILLATLDIIAAHVVMHETPCKLFRYCEIMPREWNTVFHYDKIRTVLYLNVYFLIPLLCMSYFYISMARVLLTSTGIVRSDRSLKQLEARKRTVKIALSLVVLFLICWLPRNIFDFSWYIIDITFNEFWFALKLIGFCLSFLNSCVNPVALYLLSRQYRHFYNKYLFCCCKCNNEVRSYSRTQESTYSTAQTALMSINNDKPAYM